MEIMEHKLGEIFQYNDEGNIVTLQVLEDNTVECKGCFFNDPVHKKCFKEGTITGWCVGRNDGNSVKFIQVNNNIMEEKRNIQISLEEAREWYNSGDSFKKELALKAYKKEELEETYLNIIGKLPYDITRKNSIKRDMYVKLLNIAAYVNSIYPKEYYEYAEDYFQYILTKKETCNNHSQPLFHKGFYINKTYIYYSEVFIITFNSEEAAKKAIDILGDELKILFE